MSPCSLSRTEIAALESQDEERVALHDPSSIICFADHLTFIQYPGRHLRP
jgi:hypothetical protein